MCEASDQNQGTWSVTSSLKPGVLKNNSLPHENSEIRLASSSVFVIVAKKSKPKIKNSASMTNQILTP